LNIAFIPDFIADSLSSFSLAFTPFSILIFLRLLGWLRRRQAGQRFRFFQLPPIA